MAVVRSCAVLACVVGCKFSPPTDKPIDAGDAMPDVPPDVPDAAPDVCMMWDPEHFDPCVVGGPQEPPTFAVAASPYTYDTTTNGGVLKDKDGLVVATSDVVVMQSDNTSVALWNLASLDVPANVVINIIGTKPLIIASWDTLVVGGTLDAGSHTAETDAAGGIDSTIQLGAGASSASCTSLAGGPGTDGVTSGGSGGGGGAGFRGTGAAGAIGDDGNTTGGSAGLAIIPTVIRAGCAGGASGKAGTGPVVAPATADTASNPGSGGGALVLAVRNSITINDGGRVLAGGGGGAGAPLGSACGGGGGGAGGFVGLDAPTITVTQLGVAAANGGAGGGSAGFARQGNKGSDGIASNARAPGGMEITGPDCGVRGGHGGAGAVANMNGEVTPMADECGGGGGGGGGGHVLVWSGALTNGGVMSPAPVVMP